MNTEEYVLESKVEALEKRVNREAQQTMQHLLTLQKRIDELQARLHALEMKDHYKEPTQQSVADFERSQSLNALSRKPTPADIESEIAKSFMEWLRTQIPNSGLFSAFQAGVKFGQSKSLPKQTL